MYLLLSDQYGALYPPCPKAISTPQLNQMSFTCIDLFSALFPVELAPVELACGRHLGSISLLIQLVSSALSAGFPS